MVKRLQPIPTALEKPKLFGRNNKKASARRWAAGKVFARLLSLFLLILLMTGCLPTPAGTGGVVATTTPTSSPTVVQITPLPTRPLYTPGQIVDYTAQSGDTLPALAARFNTTEKEIRAANPVIPSDATTMPPGFPMKIPIYYESFWSSPYQILPDSLFVNGPAQVGFDTVAYVKSQPGWLKDYIFFVGNRT